MTLEELKAKHKAKLEQLDAEYAKVKAQYSNVIEIAKAVEESKRVRR